MGAEIRNVGWDQGWQQNSKISALHSNLFPYQTNNISTTLIFIFKICFIVFKLFKTILYILQEITYPSPWVPNIRIEYKNNDENSLL